MFFPSCPLHSCPVENGKYEWMSCKYCLTAGKHLLQCISHWCEKVIKHVKSSESLLFNYQTAPTGSPIGMNAACLLLRLPLICTTASARCPMIHSCWIIDALFIDLLRASSVRPSSASPSLLFHPPLSSAWFVSSSSPVVLLSICLSLLFLYDIEKVLLLAFHLTPHFRQVFTVFFLLNLAQSSQLCVNGVCVCGLSIFRSVISGSHLCLWDILTHAVKSPRFRKDFHWSRVRFLQRNSHQAINLL